ncbi:hypothetical protein A2U01_0096722, partial [Trifolium medium]|nr:hypothetical protein [Trifolium medium]
ITPVNPRQQQWAYPWQPCATPPYEYPTTGVPHQQSGILGPKPQQAHMASAPPHMNNQAAMHTSFISPLDDQWYMDSG